MIEASVKPRISKSVVALGKRDLRFRIVHDHSLIISAREDFRAVIVEAQAKDITVVLIFHGLWFTDAGHCLFQFPKQDTTIVSTLD